MKWHLQILFILLLLTLSTKGQEKFIYLELNTANLVDELLIEANPKTDGVVIHTAKRLNYLLFGFYQLSPSIGVHWNNRISTKLSYLRNNHYYVTLDDSLIPGVVNYEPAGMDVQHFSLIGEYKYEVFDRLELLPCFGVSYRRRQMYYVFKNAFGELSDIHSGLNHDWGILLGAQMQYVWNKKYSIYSKFGVRAYYFGIYNSWTASIGLGINLINRVKT